MQFGGVRAGTPGFGWEVLLSPQGDSRRGKLEAALAGHGGQLLGLVLLDHRL